jgi:hypothetical protein
MFFSVVPGMIMIMQPLFTGMIMFVFIFMLMGMFV